MGDILLTMAVSLPRNTCGLLGTTAPSRRKGNDTQAPRRMATEIAAEAGARGRDRAARRAGAVRTEAASPSEVEILPQFGHNRVRQEARLRYPQFIPKTAAVDGCGTLWVSSTSRQLTRNVKEFESGAAGAPPTRSGRTDTVERNRFGPCDRSRRKRRKPGRGRAWQDSSLSGFVAGSAGPGRRLALRFGGPSRAAPTATPCARRCSCAARLSARRA